MFDVSFKEWEIGPEYGIIKSVFLIIPYGHVWFL